MGDSDLEEIRAKRLAQLQSQYGGGGGNPEQAKAAEERQREQDEMKHTILTQILSQGARARLNTLMVCKPEKGRAVENMLIQMARSGQLGGKLEERDLIGILEKVNEQMQKTTTVKFDRRRAAMDSSDDEL